MSSAAKASGNAAQTPKTASPLAHLSLSDLAVFIRLPPLLTVLEKEKKAADSLAEWVSAATLAKMIRLKETFLRALCTHIATHTRQFGRSEMAPFGRGCVKTQ